MNKSFLFKATSVGFIIAALLTLIYLNVQIKGQSLFILERFIQHSGWFEILILSFYGNYMFNKIVQNQKKYRTIAWIAFSIVFFSQLFLGLILNQRFLMTGELHLPIPAMIIGNPILKGEIGFMPILFLSTVLISGPAWCSQLCYFGAIDHFASNGKRKNILQTHWNLKIVLFIFFIVTFTILRIFNASLTIASIWGLVFGFLGVLISFLFSSKKKAMFHCSYWCPINIIVNLFSVIYPIKIKITETCNRCMVCINHCKYMALSETSILRNKTNINCTLCGDCLSSCHHKSIEYSFFKNKGETVRIFWIGLTVVIHTIFLALARI